ncbi:nitrilase-related carbon-nitrogen hydrolase [Zavarzinia compransoris]|uniref:Nitrilase n=1 Tax=Zavarzinia compransoris TaxID=1264899 RepID=A0A317EAF1_9PROT|nr:nitrilase-related carbon-nitrogen hydrolase [Zavarzinia compransoris]PWR23206.1 nitrilase [Zavarzinia compransoris]TDP46234.1 prepilin-type processing-associated H-X9-DG protein [Zavarzinia compransoris]
MSLNLALWATNLEPGLSSLDAWAAGVGEMLERAAADGAALLVMPEYAAAQWLSFAPALAPDAEIPWLAAREGAALERLRPLVARHGVALVAGTIPHDLGGGRYSNRANVLFPDGRHLHQDKLALTPGERDPASWCLATGDTLRVMEVGGWRFAVVICLDIELPALAVRLARLDLDFVVVPSMTRLAAGNARVFGCARARAVELMTVVAAVGAIGERPLSGQPHPNTSGAAVFLPCEEALGHTGLGPATGIMGRAAGPGPYLFCPDLPVGFVRRLRRGGAEVWPGAWDAGHLIIEDLP